MDKAKIVVATAVAGLVIIGGIIYTQIDKLAEPTGPGSGDEIDLGNGPGEPGPGSGDEIPPDSDFVNDGKDRGNGPGEPGPGSGDELPDDYIADNKDRGNGPGLPGPGSGDELPDEPEPRGPGSDEFYAGLDDDEPTGPGSGDELNVVGSCNFINFGSTCVDYVGSYWNTIEYAILNCSNEGAWSTSPCPTNYVGGCNTNSGTTQEMIMWFYNYGGDPFDQELTGYAAQACNINPYGTWIPG